MDVEPFVLFGPLKQLGAKLCCWTLPQLVGSAVAALGAYVSTGTPMFSWCKLQNGRRSQRRSTHGQSFHCHFMLFFKILKVEIMNSDKTMGQQQKTNEICFETFYDIVIDGLTLWYIQVLLLTWWANCFKGVSTSHSCGAWSSHRSDVCRQLGCKYGVLMGGIATVCSFKWVKYYGHVCLYCARSCVRSWAGSFAGSTYQQERKLAGPGFRPALCILDGTVPNKIAKIVNDTTLQINRPTNLNTILGNKDLHNWKVNPVGRKRELGSTENVPDGFLEESNFRSKSDSLITTRISPNRNMRTITTILTKTNIKLRDADNSHGGSQWILSDEPSSQSGN